MRAFVTSFRWGHSTRAAALVLAPVLAGILLFGMQASGHGGQIEIGAGAKGPVRLSAAQQAALDLKLATAGFRPLSDVLSLNGEVRPVAGRQAEVSTRISGQITRVYATLGQGVRAGQPLARVQSRLVGNPPPSVDITASMNGVIDQPIDFTGIFHIRRYFFHTALRSIGLFHQINQP